MRVNETGYNWLLEKVAKLNGRGLNGSVVVNADPVLFPVVKGLVVQPENLGDRKPESYARYFDVALTGSAPPIPGYAFVGTIEHLGDDGNILKAAPGCELPAEYRHALPLCQHCGQSRRRNSTFVLAGPHGHVQVGRNCLADFIRDAQAAEYLLAWAGAIDEILSKLHEHTGGGGKWYFGVADLNRLAVAYDITHGWVSAKQAFDHGGESSANVIRGFLCDPLRRDQKMQVVESKADCDSVRTEAQHVADWVNGVLAVLPDDKISNYESNLVVLFRQPAVTSDKIPLVCSAHRAYYGYKQRQERLSQQPGGYVGTPGERSEHQVTVKRIVQLEPGDYGDRFLVKMETATGDLLVWFTGESCSLEESPDPIWIKASVKEHAVFNERKQTVVSRVTKLDGPTPPKKKRVKKT